MTTTEDRPHISGWCAPIDGKPDCAGCAQHPNKPPCHCPTCGEAA